MGPRTAPASVRSEVAKFAIAGLAALVVLAVVGWLLLSRVTRDEAVNDAKRLTEVAARAAVEPVLTDGVARGDPAALARLDRVVRTRVLDRDVVRVRIWDASGRIVYSDRREQIGRRYVLGADDKEILEEGGVDAEISDLTRPENRFERRFGKLLEVYLAVRTTGGKPLLFETYQRYDAVTAKGADLLRAFLPALLGALIVFELIQLPLARRLALRVRRGEEERVALLQRALDASDLERRRIAADLHDGTVQELVAASYGLAAARERLGPDGGEAAMALDSAAGTTRKAVGELRSLLVDIYPARLREAGLPSVLADLADQVEQRGIATRVQAQPDLDLPDDVAALLYRTAQEAVRNALEHAEPSEVEIRLTSDDGHATLLVEDDGRGFPPEQALARREEGHFGLRLLADRVHDAGGTFEIDSKPGRGTCVCAEVPIA
ncbi:MAG: sensor histidine kinase [Thermoleophilaceae bacterium]